MSKINNFGLNGTFSSIIFFIFYFSKDVSNIQIFLGSYKLSGSGIYYGIDKSILHEDYDSPSNAFDIAVLYVNEPIEFNDKVQPIELSADEVPEGSFAQMTGWGYVNVRNKEFFLKFPLTLLIYLFQ